MNWNLIWIFILVLQLCYVSSQPVPEAASVRPDQHLSSPPSPPDEHTDTHHDEKVISVRITSSVAVARGTGKPTRTDNEHNLPSKSVKKELAFKNMTETIENEEEQDTPTEQTLRGANIEFLKQLHAKKEPMQLSPEHDFETSALRYDDEARMPASNNDRTNYKNSDAITSKILSSDDFKRFRSKSLSILDEALKLADERSRPNITDELTETKASTENVYLSTFYETEYSAEDKSGLNLSDSKESKEIDDSLAESSIKSILEIAKQDVDFVNVPLARSLHAQTSKNYIQGLRHKQSSERESSTRLTTISFNIVHDAPKATYNDHKPYSNPTHYQEHKFYETPTIYSQPAKIYSEPAQIYSEPAKVYSEPAKIYSEPAKIYSEPAKVYSEPAKFYSQPASLHLQPNPTNYSPPPLQWQSPTTVRTTGTEPAQTDENNYEIDEKVSVLTDGRSHGVQEATTEKCKQDSCKVGYVVKGRQFNKYRVEERTADGFIVGEYGVVRNEDGALRGVRYTAHSEASPSLIHDALMKFLQLK